MFAIEGAIIYSWAGSGYNEDGLKPEDWENGLSIFFPDGDADDAYRDKDSHTYWTYQYFYSSLTRDEINTWAGRTDLNYGSLDFCAPDGEKISVNREVEGWFELLQSWYNNTEGTLHPGPMW